MKSHAYVQLLVSPVINRGPLNSYDKNDKEENVFNELNCTEYVLDIRIYFFLNYHYLQLIATLIEITGASLRAKYTVDTADIILPERCFQSLALFPP